MTILPFVTFDQIQSWGLSPTSAVLLYAIVHLLVFTKGQLSKQETTREEWHDETRKKVEKLSAEYGQAIESLRHCELVKSQQSFQIKALEDELSDFRGCPSKTCPFRPISICNEK